LANTGGGSFAGSPVYGSTTSASGVVIVRYPKASV
jgi:hypothetical protein